ncbi:probable membrane-associated kinase regulator 2 [Cornus florida]|uniref:probable membrane-associated kinase regulator 2 n=1 Tax=Cornus florida TaxID=4283 RepID=UPI00289C922D|nr:probable membrane-associated kinase regulator 2 [Cornus florida]
MEAFSLFKFWRNAGAGAGRSNSGADVTNISEGVTVKNLLQTEDETDDEDSFFDLEFTAPDFDENEENRAKAVQIKSSDNDEVPHNNSTRKDGEPKLNFIKSPNDFFKGRVVPVESNSKPQSPISTLISAPKFRVLMLGFKKSKMATVQQKSPEKEQSKRFTVKCEVEEVPIASLFAGDNSLGSKLAKQRSEDAFSVDSSKPFPKDAVQKYLKIIRPLYVWVSKRYGEKTKFSDQSWTGTPLSSPATAPVCSPRKQADEKQGSRPAALRMVCKHLGKSRSASAAVRIMPSPARRDDSLMEQHDGIQSAILHCKRSFNSSREFCLYSRSASDLFLEKSINPPRKSAEEEKRSSI